MKTLQLNIAIRLQLVACYSEDALAVLMSLVSNEKSLSNVDQCFWGSKINDVLWDYHYFDQQLSLKLKEKLQIDSKLYHRN